jgi:peptidoglycan/LPS O-acetylase OafA/YrhL
MDRKQAGFYLPWVDGLRAIAAISVIFHHGPTLLNLLPLKDFLGVCGVDLFLVLSAFLLSRLLLIEHATTQSVSILNFYVRRILRIWPLYLFFVTSSLIYALSTHAIPVKEAIGWYLAHITFTQNIAVMSHLYSPLPFAGQLWTIGLEEQVYILMPILIAMYLKNANPKWLARGLAAMFVAFIFVRLSVVLLGRQHPYVWVSPLRADTFLFGICIGLCTSVGSSAHRGKPVAIFTAAAAMAALSMWVGPPGRSAVAEVFIYPINGLTCCLLIAAVDRSVLVSRFLGSTPMRHLGKISYGIYVFHLFGLWIAERAAENLGLSSSVVKITVAFAVTFLLAEISYHLLERPFLLLKERFTAIESRPA